MENKYFTPDIEDIRVGYECEFASDPLSFELNNYDRVQIGKLSMVEFNNIIRWYEGGLLDYEDLTGVVRTPYLTKEQIEAEGWEFYDSWERCTYKMSDEEKYIKYKKVYKDKKNCFDKPLIVYLTYFFNTHFIFLNNDESYDDLDTYYQGQCPSINEFRYICKLLKI